MISIIPTFFHLRYQLYNFIFKFMSLVRQSYLQMLLNECEAFSQREERQAREAMIKRIDHVYKMFKENIKEAFQTYSLDLIVKFTEIAVEIPQKFEQASEIIQILFQRIQSPSQFLIRAYLVKSKVIAYNGHRSSQKGEEMIATLKQAISYISKALDLIAGPQENAPVKGKDSKGGSADTSNKSKYAFLVYNASTTIYKITRFLLRANWQKNFTDTYERIFKLFEELEEPDHNWKSRFALILYQCLYDSEKKPDAFKVLDTLWQKTKIKPCDFQDSLFRLRVHLSKENPALAATIKKDIEGQDPNCWKVLEVLQRMRSGAIPEAQLQKQLMTVVNQISLNVLSNNEQSVNSTNLSPILQERLAESGRIALKFNFINIANSICNFLTKIRQPNQKAMVLNEYNKAELLIKRKGEAIDKKTGMMMSIQQIKQLEIDNRKEALKIMQKVMIINKKLDSSELIYEGSALIWNIALPFMCSEYQGYIIKALQLSASLLQQIDSNDHDLRTKIHLQLANIHFGNQLMFAEVQNNIMSALKLDHSIALQKMQLKFEPEEDPSLYFRPYQRYLNDYKEKIMLKTLQIINPSDLDVVTQDLWNIEGHKSETTKIDILQKCLKIVIGYEEPPFQTKAEEMLVEEEIKKKKIDYDRNQLRSFKKRKLLASEIARYSFEWQLNDFAKKACQFVLTETWESKNSIQLIIAQSKCCYYMAQIKIDELYQQNFEPIFEEHVKSGEQGEGQRITEEKAKDVGMRKLQIINYFKKGLDLAANTQQYFLIFNGAIYLWNNFLHIFRSSTNDSKLKNELTPLLQSFFEIMKTSLKEIETKNIIYYDMEEKIQIFSNIGLIYARILETQKKIPEVQKICEDLLLTSLSPNTRKLINGMKAKVTGGKAGGKVDPKKVDPKKGAVQQTQKTTGFTDTFLLDISNQLQSIQNSTNKTEIQNSILKCFETLESWKPSENDETQLELHAELWVKLARLALNEQSIKLYKYTLKCCEKSLSELKQGTDLNMIPSNRLRWYSLAEFLYSEALMKLVNPKTQEPPSVQKLLFLSLQRAIAAANKGFKCRVNVLVLDAAKQVWNVCSKLQQNRANRSKFAQHIKIVLQYLKEMKEDSETDLSLLLSGLYFKAAYQNGLYKEGEQVADMMLDFLPKNLQRSLWEAKMMFMSKQGKNELQAISSIKQADPSLQAKLWVKLARISNNPNKQQSAYTKAMEILKKEHSIQIVEVLIEYSEWQLRAGKQSVENVVRNLQYASNMLIQIQYDHCIEDDEEVDDQRITINSRSMRSKKSYASKSIKSSQKDFKVKQSDKGSSSHKSKGSSASRMNRSGRATKTVKNKNAKSVFSQREEDPNPESLNCLHYERLFRIYVILCSICPNMKEKIKYALNAKKQVVNMMFKSIRSFNEVQENAAKFNEKDQKSGGFKTIELPSTIEEWINFQLPKDYIDKISKIENFNFMGTYTFEKPQLTYFYLCKLCDFLNNFGISFESIPVKFVTKYMTKYILKNDNYYLLEELKLKRILQASRHPLEHNIKINFEELIISEEDIRDELLKSEYYKSSGQEESLELVYSPNLIKPLTRHECWFSIGKILVEFGEIYAAKIFLRQSLRNAKILNNFQLMGQINLCNAQISFLEGQNSESVQSLLLAHRLCKSSSSWQQILRIAVMILTGIRKYEVLKTFLIKITSTIEQLIEDSSNKNAKEKAIYKSEVYELKQILVSALIANVYLSYRETLEEDNSDNRKNYSSSIKNLQTFVNENHGFTWSMSNYKVILDYFNQMFTTFETRGGNSLLELGLSNYQKLFSILKGLDKETKQFISSLDLNKDESDNYNSIIDIKIRIGFLAVKGYTIEHKLTNHFDPDSSDQNNPIQNEQIKKYLMQIDQEIKLKQSPVQVKLNQLELALALLYELETHVPENSYYHPRLLALLAYVHSLLNKLKGEGIEAAEQFKSKGQEKMLSIEDDIFCYEHQSKAFIAVVEQKSSYALPQTFQYLAKSQHSTSVMQAFDFLRKKLNPNNKFLTSLRITQKGELSKSFVNSLFAKQRLYSSLSKFPAYQQCLKLMPKNSAYVTLQVSCCKTQIYCSIMINEPQTSNKKIIFKQKSLSNDELRVISNLSKTIHTCKKNLIKTPIENNDKLVTILSSNEQKLVEIAAIMNTLNQWWMKDFVQYLSTPRVTQAATQQKDKKGGKDQKKKGGKDEIAGYESPLPSSPSGIESITYLLDEFLYSLPFEELISSELVLTASKDTSLFWVSRKLQEINFQSELNNSNGYGADKGKYFGYDFKTSENNFKSIANQILKNGDGIKFEAIDSSNRMPSLGDYNRCLSELGYIQIYGCVDFLNHLKISTLVEYVGLSKVKLLIVHDNLNFSKAANQKYRDLNSESASLSIEENELSLAIVSNLLNVTLIKNRWFTTPQNMQGRIKILYKSFGSGIYIGGTLRQERKAEDKLTDKWMFYLHGPAVTRI